MAIFQQDLAYTFRRLSRAPGFVIAVVVSIGLGIAANATIFSMVSRFVLRPAPVGDPSRLLNLRTLHDGDQCCNNFPEPLFRDVRDHVQSFSGVAAYDAVIAASIGGNGQPERVWGQAASTGFFDVLQLPMAIGRGFASDEENGQVIVLSHTLWQRRFASDPAIAGKVVSVSGHPYTVVGVTPAGFRGVDLILAPEFWVPLGNVDSLATNIKDRENRDMHWLSVIARLKPGVSMSQTNAELETLAQRLAIAYPATDKGNHFRFSPIQAGSFPERYKTAVSLFLASLCIVVLLVLAIACVNVANLLLAQTVGRQREMAVRLALGATRVRILRQMVLESVLLSVAGGGLGVLLSMWAMQALASFHIPAPIPLDLSLSLDWRTLAYTFALSVGAGLFFGITPALAASRPMMARALKGEDALARPGRKWTLRNTLIVIQVAMCVVLLSATGLFLRSLQEAAKIDIGFRSDGIVSFSVDPGLNGYNAQRTMQFLSNVRQRVAALPGVISVVASDSLPLNGGNRSDGFSAVVKPKSMTTSDPNPSVELYMATPGYFDTLGIPRLSGRDFTNESPTGPKVAIVNQEFVKQVFAGEDPIGQTVNGGGTTYQVVGVVGNIKSRTLGEATRPVLFRSLDQTVSYEPASMGYTLLVRTASDPRQIIESVRGQIRAVDPAIAIDNIKTIQEHMHDAFLLPRLAATLFSVFGVIGLTLAAVGLYGVMNYSVSRRTREIGIRMALGAQLGVVQRLIVRQGMVLVAIALVLGMPAAFALSKLFGSVLYGVHTDDPLTFAAVPVFLAAVAFIACWLPARRASRVNPQIVLRCE